MYVSLKLCDRAIFHFVFSMKPRSTMTLLINFFHGMLKFYFLLPFWKFPKHYQIDYIIRYCFIIQNISFISASFFLDRWDIVIISNESGILNSSKIALKKLIKNLQSIFLNILLITFIEICISLWTDHFSSLLQYY